MGWAVNTAVEKDYYHTLLRSGYSTDSLLEDCDYYYCSNTHTHTHTFSA